MDIIKEIKEQAEKLSDARDAASVLYAQLCGDIEYLIYKDMCDRCHKNLQYIVGHGHEGGFCVISIDVYNCKEFTREYYDEMFENYQEELQKKLFPNGEHSLEIYNHQDSKCERNLL